MKIIIGLTILLLSCISNGQTPSNLPNRIFEIPPLDRKESSREIKDLLREANSLNSIIGRYPPRYRTEEEREKTFTLWSDLLKDANAMRQDNEDYLFLNAQLYRQGHNMDVRYAAKKADELIRSCISTYKNSEKCHLEATYLYLQVGPPDIKLAKNSLKTLRKIYKPQLNEDVEAGYVFAYVYSRDDKKAEIQIKKYLKAFPNSSRAEMFKKILNGIKSGGIQVKSN